MIGQPLFCATRFWVRWLELNEAREMFAGADIVLSGAGLGVEAADGEVSQAVVGLDTQNIVELDFCCVGVAFLLVNEGQVKAGQVEVLIHCKDLVIEGLGVREFVFTLMDKAEVKQCFDVAVVLRESHFIQANRFVFFAGLLKLEGLSKELICEGNFGDWL